MKRLLPRPARPTEARPAYPSSCLDSRQPTGSRAAKAAAPLAAGCLAPVSAALDARALVVGEPTRLRAPALSRVPLPAGLALLRGGRVDANSVVLVDGGGAADVVAAWPGLFRAPDGCANASAGLRVAVGTGRGVDGRLRLGDVSWDYSSL